MSAVETVSATILRTATGEPPLGRGGEFFLPEQGERLDHDNPRYRAPNTVITLLALDNGAWLASPPSLHVSRPQYPSRDAALRAAIAALIRRARKYMRNGEGQGTQWTEGFAGRVIEWALSLKPAPLDPALEYGALDAIESGGEVSSAIRARLFAEKLIDNTPGAPDDYRLTAAGLDRINRLQVEAEAGRIEPDHDRPEHDVAQADVWMHSGDDAEQLTRDPVVRMLVEAHRARRQYPAKHTFSMTNPIQDGRIMIQATCACGHVISFGANDQLRVDAAVEAHWRRHGDGPKIDGRGIPIKPGDGARISGSKQKVSGAPIAAGVENGIIELNAEDGAANSAAKSRRRRKADAHPKAGDAPDLAKAALTEPDLLACHAGGFGSTGIESSDGGVEGHAPVEAQQPGNAGQQTQCRSEVPCGSEATADHVSVVRTSMQAAGVEPGPSEVDAAAQICAGDDLPSPLAGEGAERSEAGEGYLSATSAVDAYPSPPAPLPPGEASLRLGERGEEDDLAIDWPSYDQFLEDKIVVAPLRGIEVTRDSLHPYLKPHCKDLVVWSLRLGCAAIFASFGLHKTAMQLEWCRQLVRHTGQPSLNVVPLGVRHGFIAEAEKLGMDVRFVRTTAEVDELYCEGVRHFLTNYESIREGKLDVTAFDAVALDEASVLRSYGSKTFQEFLPLFTDVPFKLVATATPSPNRYKELIHYAGFLGVMDTGLALTRFFQRNSEKAGDLTLYPHKEDEFWMWVHSWAAFLQKPSELGHSDDGYELPPLTLRWHEVPTDHSKAEPERDGQGVMFRDVAVSLQDAAKARRDSLAARIARMSEIIAASPGDHFLIWHDLEAEREAIEQALPGVVTITGSGMDIDERERRLHDFEEGRTQYFATKPVLSGSGSNFQYHCHRAIYVALPGYGYKFNDFIQSLYRLQRFGQERTVEVDIIYAEDERQGRAALEAKWALDTEMRVRMSEIIRTHGLNTLPLRDALLRAIGVQRVEIRGKGWLAINNDAVSECQAWPEASVDLIVTSIPFSNHYEYSPSYRDFGHTDDNGHFWSQMDFLTCELARMLKPGRLACIHVKDRVLFGAVTGEGVPTISPFHAEAIMHYRAHGLQYMGMITVVTDVVRENNQTYRLGWSECAKDGTKMGVGCPEYVLLFRRRQSDRSRGYADTPVTKDKEVYTRARWQIDAHGYWRSSGNRLLSTEEFARLESADLARLFAKTSAERVYDYEAHVRIGEALERQGTLPATFMAIAPGSHHDAVWHDVNRMRTLNMLQQRKGAEMHLCLARDSRVLTRERGYVSIQDVSVGEHCLTHKGRWRPVLVVANTGVQPVVTIRAQGVPGLTVTPDHKLWVRKSDWVRQRDGAERAVPAWMEAQVCLGGYVNQKLPDIEEPTNDDVLHWWIVGRWLADGHWEDRGSAIISCGAHELNSLIDGLGGRAGGRYWTGTSWQIRVLDPDGSLKATLRQCGAGAAGKHLPPEAVVLPLPCASALLAGYLSGDGHRHDGRNRWMVTAVSRDLLLGMSLLAQRVHGVVASVYEGRPERDAEIDGRLVHCRQEWVFTFDLPDARRKTPFVLDDGAWKRVRAIEDAGEIETWCLRVADDESFTAEGCIVKNCPLQFDIVDRLIERFSNEGELVFDPFGGLMTVPYRALLKKRRGAATELSASYFMDGVHYLRLAEEQMGTPDLFDLMAFDKANASPPEDMMERADD